MNENKRSMRILTWLCVGLAALVMIGQMINYTSALVWTRYGVILRFLPYIAHNLTIMFVPMVFGAVYGQKRKAEFAEIFRIWLMAVTTLILFYLVYYIAVPINFRVWSLFGVFLPLTTSTSIILAAVIFGLLFKAPIINFQAKMNQRQNLLVLTFLTIAGFALSAGTMKFNYNIYALYLVLYFAWGMFLGHAEFKKKTMVILIVLGAICFLFMAPGVHAFLGMHSIQRLKNWNGYLLANPTSPFMFLIINAAFLLFRPVIMNLRRYQLRSLVPAIIFMNAPISPQFANSFAFTTHSKLNKVILFLILLIMTFVLSKLYERFLFRRKKVRRLIAYLSQSSSAVLVLEDGLKHLVKWMKRRRVTLLTWLWFFLLSYLSFVMQFQDLRVEFLTQGSMNAITYVLGQRLLMVVLATIFIYAIFTVLYFVTTRYWVANIISSIFLIGWAIANRIKLNLRGEPIYPSEMGEAVNAKSLLSFVNQRMLIIIGVALLVLLVLMIYLEIRHPIKRKGSWLKHGIWALLSILLFLTPAQFNHENSIIHYLVTGFGDNAQFKNPERELEDNGPLINFLNYIDLRAMNKPSNYSKNSVEKIASHYRQVAKAINKTRKNDISKQTIVFNLSESFVDPYTFPTIKMSKGTPNPVPYIQSLKNKATYGTMLSAGYGGGTADMEWESLTGFNMGLFRTMITPYVQIVPYFKFYPTIGMQFKEASAVHPYIGTYYSRVENYKRFKFQKFIYLGSKYKIIDQKKIDHSPYNSDETAYVNGLKQINSVKHGQFINLITMQNHMPYNNWYNNNEYQNRIGGAVFANPNLKQQMATYVKGVQYTDTAVKQFIGEIDKIKKPITLVFYGDHYPAILPQTLTDQYPIQMHSTRYFIYANKYAREHGVKAKLQSHYKEVNTSDFIAMMLAQTNSKVTPYQALLTKIHEELPAITINFKEGKGYELINQKGKQVSTKSLSNQQQALLKDYEMIQYDMTAGKAYALKGHNFYN